MRSSTPFKARLVSVLAVAASTFAAPGAAQGPTIPVQGGGAALANAVQTAASGTVLIVSPDTYEPFHIDNKTLTIVAPARATIQPPPGLCSSCSIQTQVSNGSVATLVGLDILPNLDNRGLPTGGQILVNASEFLIEDCTASGMSIRSSSGGIVNSSTSGPVAPVQAGLAITSGSEVFVSGGVFQGGAEPAPYGYPGFVSYPGIASLGSTVRAERVTARTGVTPTGPGDTAALSVAGGLVTIQDSVMTSQGRPDIIVFSPQPSPPAQLNVAGTSTPNGVSVVDGRSTITTDKLPTGELVSSAFTIGQPTSFEFTAAPNTPIGVFFSWGVPRLTTIPGLLGEPVFLFGTPRYFHLLSGTTDSQGDLSVAVTLPNLLQLQYESMWLTAIAAPSLPAHSSVPAGGVVR